MTELVLNIDAWRAATKDWSPAAQQMALTVAIYMAENGLAELPEPDMTMMSEWSKTADIGLWSVIQPSLQMHAGHYLVPWVSPQTRAPKRQPAAWRSFMDEEPLVSDPLIRDLWRQWHEMRATLAPEALGLRDLQALARQAVAEVRVGGLRQGA